MLRLILVCVVTCIEASNLNLEGCKQYTSPEPDYYWRPYDGVIPGDAIEGGYDIHNNVTYIGQIPLTSIPALNPATIIPGNKIARSSYFGVYFQDRDVKILCSGNPGKMKWIPATTDDLFLITDYHLVVGGFEFVNGRFLVTYIGRINHEGSLIIGKVLTNESEHRGLKIPTLNGRQFNTHTFELLVYEKEMKAKTENLTKS